MAKRTASAIGGLFDIFASAISVSRAVESKRQPAARDLQALGIDPIAFRKINRF